MKDIAAAPYLHTKRVCKDLITKILGEYHVFYNQRDTLLLDDVFENFRNTCLEIYEHDPVSCFNAPGLAWHAALKKIKIKLDLVIDTDILLMV